MFCCLLLKKLVVITLGDNLHHVILSCEAVENMPECLAYDRML
jgi:hypothetical protein